MRYPSRWGNQSLHTISLFFFLDCVHMRGGVPHGGGLLGQPGRVTRLGGVSFLNVNAAAGIPRLTGVIYL